jgi:hypothetical protein
MRIAYLVYCDIGHECGVVKKIAGQLKAWVALVHEVRLFAASPPGPPWRGLEGVSLVSVPSTRIATHVFRTRELVRQVLAWEPDMAYVRFHLYYPGLRRLMRRVPTCLEMNTNDLVEQRNLQPWYECLYHRATRGRALAGAAGFVCVTREIAEGLKRFDKPVAIIANGVPLDTFDVLPAPANREPHLVFMAGEGERPWYGVDKLLAAAENFSHWTFHLVGLELAGRFSTVPPNLKSHGRMTRLEYESILRRADVGVGSLALHRNRMDEACVLKVREYLACGIPALIAYRDTDFPDGAPFLLQLPNREDNVASHLPEIEAFVAGWKGQRVPRDAVRHLDTEVKEQQRLAFFGRLTGGDN